MNPRKLTAGYIYSDVIKKRLDNSSYQMGNSLQKAYIANSELHFEDSNGFELAMQEGIFMLKIPHSLDLTSCDDFAQNFYKNLDEEEKHNEGQYTIYKKFRAYSSENFENDNLLGFHERIDQIEQFLLEKRFWKQWYPSNITKVGNELCTISGIIIKRILDKVGISKKEYSIATGGCAEGQGSYHLTFNHYRPQVNTKGLSSHKDDGFVTILRTVSPGLEVNRYEKWEKVEVDHEYFIINFGLAMEILTRNSMFPVSAIMHRVVQQKIDRWSWGHFTSSKCISEADQGIYEYSVKYGLRRMCNSRELINNNDHEIYYGTKIKVVKNEG